MHTIYTLGYSGIQPEQLRAAAEQHDLVVLDVRFSPRSRRPEWTRKRLQALLGERYVHLPALGNINYKGEGPIQLADPETGIAAAAKVLEGQPVLLLCACRDVQTCHRRDAADLLAAATGAPVVHWTPGDLAGLDGPPAPPDPAQLTLW